MGTIIGLGRGARGASKAYVDAEIARVEGEIPEVEANVTDTPTVGLNSLKLDGTTYSVEGKGAETFDNISAMVTALNAMDAEKLQVGGNIYISTLDVPDLWVRKNDETSSVPYTYTTDAAFKSALSAAGESGLQIGYYRVRPLEAEKVLVPVQDVRDSDGNSMVSGGVVTLNKEVTFDVDYADGTSGTMKLYTKLT